MNPPFPPDSKFSELRSQGWQAFESFFSSSECSDFLEELKNLEKSQRLKKAKIGKKTKKKALPRVRLTEIFWIQNLNPTPTQKFFLDRMLALMDELKRECFLPLNNLETHYSIYPKGGFYQRHKDQFQGDTSRQVSFILYLNPTWSEADGGELVIFNEKRPEEIDRIFLPAQGRLVVFLSESIEHEVRPTRKKRYSLTGWMRTAQVQKDPLAILR